MAIEGGIFASPPTCDECGELCELEDFCLECEAYLCEGCNAALYEVNEDEEEADQQVIPWGRRGSWVL